MLDGMLDDEIQISLAYQFVPKTYRVTGKRDGKPFTLRTVFLTFEVPTLPSSLLVGYESIRLPIHAKPYVVCSVPEVLTHPTKVCVEPSLWQLVSLDMAKHHVLARHTA